MKKLLINLFLVSVLLFTASITGNAQSPSASDSSTLQTTSPWPSYSAQTTSSSYPQPSFSPSVPPTSTPRSTATARPAKIRAVENLIRTRERDVLREIAKTEQMREFLPPSEYSAVITDLQGMLQQLSNYRDNLSTENALQTEKEVKELKINIKIKARVQLRRKAGLLKLYNDALINGENKFNELLEQYTSNTNKYQTGVACIAEAKTIRENGLGLLNGVMSQLGLLEITSDNDIRQIIRNLDRQLIQAKQQFDKSRRSQTQCYLKLSR